MTCRMLNHALQASFADTNEQRDADRRVLRLEARVATPKGEGGVRVHNLSRTGMLVESDVDVVIGTQLEVELPGGKRHRAEVVWSDEGLIGCRFERSLSQATLSAALLRSAPQPVAASVDAPNAVEEMRVALREVWEKQERAVEEQTAKMGLGSRIWIILGLGAAGWAVPATAAWMLFR